MDVWLTYHIFLLDTLTSTVFDNVSVLNFGSDSKCALQCILEHNAILFDANY